MLRFHRPCIFVPHSSGERDPRDSWLTFRRIQPPALHSSLYKTLSIPRPSWFCIQIRWGSTQVIPGQLAPFFHLRSCRRPGSLSFDLLLSGSTSILGIKSFCFSCFLRRYHLLLQVLLREIPFACLRDTHLLVRRYPFAFCFLLLRTRTGVDIAFLSWDCLC
jgi:hypothetical protein